MHTKYTFLDTHVPFDGTTPASLDKEGGRLLGNDLTGSTLRFSRFPAWMLLNQLKIIRLILIPYVILAAFVNSQISEKSSMEMV